MAYESEHIVLQPHILTSLEWWELDWGNDIMAKQFRLANSSNWSRSLHKYIYMYMIVYDCISMFVCLFVCLPVCLSVCLSVCLLRHLMQDETFRNQPEPAPYPPCIPRSQEWRMHGPNWRADIPPLRHESQKRAHTRPNLTSRKVTSGRRRFIIFLEGCTKINIKCA